ncbi:MAG: hypothetical protein ACJ79S_07720 [Gemmatimonadaceae bacterium]
MKVYELYLGRGAGRVSGHRSRDRERGGRRARRDDRRHGVGRRVTDHQRTALGGGEMAALGFLGGLTIGVALWSNQLHRSKRDLFSRNPLRRLAALGYVSGRPSIDNARLLRDYIRWESRPLLRRRAEQVLRQVEEYLE